MPVRNAKFYHAGQPRRDWLDVRSLLPVQLSALESAASPAAAFIFCVRRLHRRSALRLVLGPNVFHQRSEVFRVAVHVEQGVGVAMRGEALAVAL